MQWFTERKDDFQKERSYIRYGIVLFACIDVMCLRETVFWITGMMNYLFPAVLFLLGIWVFQKNRVCGTPPVGKKILFWILCFFVASSVEQYALMFVGFMTLTFVTDLFRKRKCRSYLWIGYALALAGLAVLILAPGNFARVRFQENLKPPLIYNLWTLVYQNTFSPVAFPFLLMLSICGNLVFLKRCRSKLVGMVSCSVTVGTLAINCIPILEKAIIISLLLCFIAVQLTWLFLYRTYNAKQDVVPLIFVGIGSQVMLLISAIWGFRCMFSMYMVYMILILICLQEPKIEPEDRALVLCSGITASLYPPAVVGIWLLFVLLRNKKKAALAAGKILSVCAVLASLAVLVIGYAHNAPTHFENIGNTRASVETGELILHELPEDTYSWYFVPFGDFHEHYYRLYYDLPNSVRIEYAEIDNDE